MSRTVRVARWSVGVVVAVAAVVALLLLTVPRTDWAHRQARSVLLDALEERVNGTVRVGDLRGNLLREATLEDVVVEDSVGRRVARVERVTVSYALAPLLRKRIRIDELELVRPRVRLERPPGGEWNVTGLVVEDTAAPAEEAPEEGFGSRLRIGELRIVEGRATVRSPWEPPESLEGPALDSAVAAALSDRNRTRVVRAGDGYRVVREVEDLDARLSDLVVTDPEDPVSGVVRSLSATALPFRPPPLSLRQLEGRFSVTEDSVLVDDVRLQMPGSELRASGATALDADGARGRVEVERLSAADLAWLEPELPDDARASLVAEVRRADGTTRLSTSEMDLAVGDARLEGRAEVTVGEDVRPGPADLAFERLDTRLVERIAGDLELPVDGVAEGRIALGPTDREDEVEVDLEVAFRERPGGTESRLAAEGRMAVDDRVRAREMQIRLDPLHLRALTGLRPELADAGEVAGTVALDGDLRSAVTVDADLVHRSPAGARSALLATGALDLEDAPAARGLELRLDPLRVTALEPFTGRLGVGGSVSGRVTVDGAPPTGVSAAVDLQHRDTTGLTRLAGEARLGPERSGGRRVEADLRVPALALRTAGALMPDAGLRGSAGAELAARGTLSDLAFDLEVDVEEGGGLRANGTVDVERPGRAYDLLVGFDRLDASAISADAPATALRGSASLRGRGTDPATLDGRLEADLEDAEAGSLGTAALRVTAAASDGRVRVERGEVRVASARATLDGELGLVEERSGELRYRLAVDSLSDFARFLPEPEEDAEPPADTAAAERGDSLAGGLRLAGTLAGNPERLDAWGRAELGGVEAPGLRTRDGWVEFDVADARSERRSVAGAVLLTGVRAAGLAFDSVGVNVVHREAPDSAEGTAALTLVQDPDRDYRVRAGYTLELDARELRLEEAGLRFDTVRWSSARPARVRWGGSGVAVDSLELVSDAGGRIFADGRFVAEEAPGRTESGSGPLVVEVEDLEVAQLMGLLQRDTLRASGRLSARVTASGPPSAARVEGTLSLDEPFHGPTPLPEVEARVQYAPGALEGSLRLLRHDTLGPRQPVTLVRADGSAEVDLLGAGLEVSRNVDVRVRADSLPLEGTFRFTDAVEDVRGRIRGDVTVGGTLDDVDVEGRVDLDLGRMDVVEPGLQLRDIVGTMRFLRDSVVLDSLRLRSRGGPVRMAGGVDLVEPDRPRFDLSLTARDAQVLNDHRYGQRVRADADLELRGPYDSLAVDGEVRVLEGTLLVAEARGDLLDLEQPLAQRAIRSMQVEPEAAPEPNPVLEGLRADVELTIARNTWVRAREGTVEIYTPEDGSPLLIRYDASAGGLALDGILHADRGEYTFAGRRFEVTTGTATFLAQATVDPLLHLTATHEVERPGREALTIQINVVGRLFEPRVVLTSDAEPPLPQSDLISYLVFGTSSASLLQGGNSGLTGGSRELGALATQQLASLALSSLVDEAFANLETSAATTGVDVFRIEPADLPDELAFDGYLENLLRGTQVEAGEYLTRRLFLGVRARATLEAWPGLRAEYRMPGGLRWTASWEAGYLPGAAAFAPEAGAARTRILSTFLFWESRAGLRSETPTDGPGN